MYEVELDMLLVFLQTTATLSFTHWACTIYHFLPSIKDVIWLM